MKRGDIIINGDTSHTMIGIGPNKMAHVVYSGMATVPWTPKARDWVFTHHDSKLAEEAAKVAEAFAVKVIDEKRTPYGDGPSWEGDYSTGSEIVGMTRELPVKDMLGVKDFQAGVMGLAWPFSVDSLYRAFKWAAKMDEGKLFSTNRGTTCCTFVIACYHAAAVRLTFPKKDLVTVATHLRKGRFDKPRGKIKNLTTDPVKGFKGLFSDEVQKAKKSENWAYPMASNAGGLTHSKTDYYTEDYDLLWQSLLGQCNVELTRENYLCKEFIPLGMLVDAKYIHSSTLHRLLLANQNDWNHVQEPKMSKVA